MNSLHLKWGDIVSSVEKAHLEATKNLKVRERMINRKYVQDADQQIRKKKQQLSQKKLEELQEKMKIEEEIIRQDTLRKMTKQLKLKKEKEYSKDNFDIMLAFKPSDKRESTYSEHPFSSLVDQADKRRENFREKLRRQNQINILQQKIKLKQENQRKIGEKQQRQKYINHIQAFYLKKIEDRNIFKNKYLKLSNPQRSQLLPQFHHKTIQKDYQTINEVLMKNKCQRNTQFDDSLSKINKNIDVPDSSPAFLGRIPINNDRRKQLDYLQKSAYHYSGQSRRMKTEGDLCDSQLVETKRYANETQQLPVLEKYYHNLSTANDSNLKLQYQSRVESSKSPLIGYKKLNESSLIRNTTHELREKQHHSVNKYQFNHNQQRSQNSTTKKVYSTYDIIQNKRKFVCL